MLTKFAYFAMILSGFGVLLSVGMPFVIRARTYYQFHRFGMDSAVDSVANAELHSVAPSLVLSLILSVAGVFLAIGLLRRREWARRGWLVICGIWLASAIVFTILAPEMPDIFRLAFRLIILAVSFRVLLKPRIRDEFTNQHHATERA